MAERLNFNKGANYINGMEIAEHVARYSILSGLVSGLRVLDIACGEGYGTWLIKEWGATEVIGVDISNDAINSAKRNFSRSGVNFYASDACNIKKLFGDKKFDVIASFETIEHLTDPISFLHGIKELCNGDTKIFISCPNDYAALPEGECNPYHLRKYKFKEFADLTENIMGHASQWLFGVNVQGYALVDVEEPLLSDEWRELKSLVKTRPLSPGQLIPSQINVRPNADNVLFYIGIWGLDKKTSALAVTAQSYSAFIEPWKVIDRKAKEINRLEDFNLDLKAKIKNLSDDLDNIKKANLNILNEKDRLSFTLTKITDSRPYKAMLFFNKILRRLGFGSRR